MLDPSRLEPDLETLRAGGEAGGEAAGWLRWLVQLRWISLAAQVAVIALSWTLLDRPVITIPAMVTAMLLLAATNHMLTVRLREPRPVPMVAVMLHLAIDVTVLTLLLGMSGGPSNPFVVLYLIHVSLGAMMLRGEHLAGVLSWVLICFAVLHIVHLPLHVDQYRSLPGDVVMGAGQTLAFVVTALSIVSFVAAMARSLRQREAPPPRPRPVETDEKAERWWSAGDASPEWPKQPH